MNRFFALLVLIIGCIVGFAILAFTVLSTVTTDEIVMVQPNGWTVERDYRYSETNLNNSQANNYNAQANVNNAVATKIVSNANPPFFESFKLGMACTGTAVMFLFVIGFLLLHGQRISEPSHPRA